MHDASIVRFAVLTCSSTRGMTGHEPSTSWHRWTDWPSCRTADTAMAIVTEITTGIAIGFATPIATIVATDAGVFRQAGGRGGQSSPSSPPPPQYFTS